MSKRTWDTIPAGAVALSVGKDVFIKLGTTRWSGALGNEYDGHRYHKDVGMHSPNTLGYYAENLSFLPTELLL